MNLEQRVYGVSHVPLPVSETKRQEQIHELLELSKVNHKLMHLKFSAFISKLPFLILIFCL